MFHSCKYTMTKTRASGKLKCPTLDAVKVKSQANVNNRTQTFPQEKAGSTGLISH